MSMYELPDVDNQKIKKAISLLEQEKDSYGDMISPDYLKAIKVAEVALKKLLDY